MKFHLDHVSIAVSDVEKSAAFYRDVLGLKVLRTTGTPIDGAWMGDGESDDMLHLNEGPLDGLPPPKSNHLAFRTPAFQVLIERFKTLGVPYFDWPGNRNTIGKHPLGFQQVYVNDPDGYWVEINDVSKPNSGW